VPGTGCAGTGITETLNFLFVMEPHELFAVTEIIPLFAPTLLRYLLKY
jgi:hypothetical protein